MHLLAPSPDAARPRSLRRADDPAHARRSPRSTRHAPRQFHEFPYDRHQLLIKLFLPKKHKDKVYEFVCEDNLHVASVRRAHAQNGTQIRLASPRHSRRVATCEVDPPRVPSHPPRVSAPLTRSHHTPHAVSVSSPRGTGAGAADPGVSGRPRHLRGEARRLQGARRVGGPRPPRDARAGAQGPDRGLALPRHRAPPPTPPLAASPGAASSSASVPAWLPLLSPPSRLSSYSHLTSPPHLPSSPHLSPPLPLDRCASRSSTRTSSSRAPASSPPSPSSRPSSTSTQCPTGAPLCTPLPPSSQTLRLSSSPHPTHVSWSMHSQG